MGDAMAAGIVYHLSRDDLVDMAPHEQIGRQHPGNTKRYGHLSDVPPDSAIPLESDTANEEQHETGF